MTTPTTLPIDLYSNGGDPDYVLTIKPLPEDERLILKSILELQRTAAEYMLDVSKHDLDPRPAEYPWHDGGYESSFEKGLSQFDYNGDHVDYNPACAYALATLTAEICGDGHMIDELNEDIVNAIDPSRDKDYVYGPRGLLAALLSNTEFLENLDTWGHSGSDYFSIDHKDDLN